MDLKVSKEIKKQMKIAELIKEVGMRQNQQIRETVTRELGEGSKGQSKQSVVVHKTREAF